MKLHKIDFFCVLRNQFRAVEHFCVCTVALSGLALGLEKQRHVETWAVLKGGMQEKVSRSFTS